MALTDCTDTQPPFLPEFPSPPFAPDRAPLQLQWYGTGTSMLGARPESTSAQAYTPVCPGTPGPASNILQSYPGPLWRKVRLHTLTDVHLDEHLPHGIGGGLPLNVHVLCDQDKG
jgi:hypothetical protein